MNGSALVGGVIFGVFAVVSYFVGYRNGFHAGADYIMKKLREP